MIDDETLEETPVPALDLRNELIDLSLAPVMWLLKIDSDGNGYYLEWNGNGFVIRTGESYLCKSCEMKYSMDIESFKHSNIGSAEKWDHVYSTKQEAIDKLIESLESGGDCSETLKSD